MTKYETIIGLEVHAQLKTASKMFCSCSAAFGDEPNTNICPICTAQPGTLPRLNRDAVDMAIRAVLALGGHVQVKSVFARKNYFYPDLPKGYQISQHELPLGLGGRVSIRTDGEEKKISIVRLHLEEDAGKLLHDYGDEEYSHIDFNRCGIPLIEIVSGSDIRSPQEAGDYLRTLRNILVYLDVCEGNMQEGNFRCDANVSVRPEGQLKFGTRTELKNINSFKAVEKALAYEVKRQIELVSSGGCVAQETLTWCEATSRTEPMRSKEEIHDYRYFPDPDLMPLIIDDGWIDDCKLRLPELANDKAQRFMKQYGLPEYDAFILVDDRDMANYYEQCVKHYYAPKKLSNWIMTELMHELKEGDVSVTSCPVEPEQMAELVKMVENGVISGKMGKDVFLEMYGTGKDAESIVSEKGLKQESDETILEKLVDEVILNNPDEVQRYKDGRYQLMSFFVGRVMKATRGQANPKIVNELLKKKLK